VLPGPLAHRGRVLWLDDKLAVNFASAVALAAVIAFWCESSAVARQIDKISFGP
jgi:hypothetical protein